MSRFYEVPGQAGVRSKVRNDDGVLIDPLHSHRQVLYQIGKKQYLLYKECGPIRKADGSLSSELYDFIYTSDCFIQGTGNISLPEDLLNRVREDLPEAYAALGLKCVIDPPPNG